MKQRRYLLLEDSQHALMDTVYSATVQHFEPKKTFWFVAIVFWPTTLRTCNAGIAKFDQAALSVVAIEGILINQST